MSICEFHTMHPDHTHFPVFPGSLPLVTLPEKKKKRKEIVLFMYSLEHAQTSSDQTLPSLLPETINCEGSLSQFLRILFTGFLSRLFLLGVWSREGRLSQTPMSLIIKFGSAVIKTTAKEPSLHFIVSDSMDRGLPYGLFSMVTDYRHQQNWP